MKGFIIEKGKEFFTSQSGLALIGAALEERTVLGQRVDQEIPQRHGIKHSDVLKSYCGLMSLGKTDFETIRQFQGDRFFKQALGLKQLISCERLRQRMDLHAVAYQQSVDQAVIDFLTNVQATITPERTGHVAIDIDMSLFDNSNSHKEGVNATYKRFHGYAPNAAYLGREGYCLAFELREGRQHCQTDTPFTLRRSIKSAHRLVPNQPLLVRLDSGYDAVDNFLVCEAGRSVHPAGVDFIVKYNPRTHKNPADWVALVDEHQAWQSPHPGKRVALFSMSVERYTKKTHQGGVYRRIVRVTEIAYDKNGQLLLTPEIAVEGWWTSLNLPDQDVIHLYNQRGTSEQFHSEFKTDLERSRLDPTHLFETLSILVR